MTEIKKQAPKVIITNKTIARKISRCLQIPLKDLSTVLGEIFKSAKIDEQETCVLDNHSTDLIRCYLEKKDAYVYIDLEEKSPIMTMIYQNGYRLFQVNHSPLYESKQIACSIVKAGKSFTRQEEFLKYQALLQNQTARILITIEEDIHMPRIEKEKIDKTLIASPLPSSITSLLALLEQSLNIPINDLPYLSIQYENKDLEQEFMELTFGILSERKVQKKNFQLHIKGNKVDLNFQGLTLKHLEDLNLLKSYHQFLREPSNIKLRLYPN